MREKKKKNIALIVFIVVLILFVAGLIGFAVYATLSSDEFKHRHAKHDDWQTIRFEGFGTIRIPSEWGVYINDDLIYIVDENDNPVMIESDLVGEYREKENRIYEKNTLCEYTMIYHYFIGECYSEYVNDSIAVVETESKKSKKRMADLYADYSWEDYIRFIVWDDELDNDTYMEILYTYEPEE